MRSSYITTILGRVVDPSLTSVPQEILNAESLYIHDQYKLLELIKKRISIYALEDYLYDLRFSPQEYWINVLRVIISHYFLTSLRIYLSPNGFKEIDLKIEVSNLLKFLKYELLEVLVEAKISEDILFLLFRDILNKRDIKVPILFSNAMLYIDEESFKKFMRVIVGEARDRDFNVETYDLNLEN